ncbi:uncharacterized protein PGTG_06422 [Puccinia graminis f. sp. tritici CRL 75-36-700-3]|uniref:Uncharacterized protein n=1 Tax=Puccinia graminis f. sp. tritici (strain CRL 75-36-700-3 / race SCCL) TaxID=418459 RepID=E3K7E6_PUCGT|nr:uncharacterized protein PGTG_06422 [Puccinia graminis f. sp. tritici CRL 75-36-700-3]EFP80466.1 hypothetical protein PGTG_06422 [Puccinia graminis f. sp. tritici CRL 75-36-700-3]
MAMLFIECEGVSVIPQLREDVFATGFRRLNDRRQRSKVIYRFFIAVSLIWITSRMAWFLLSLITREPLACEVRAQSHVVGVLSEFSRWLMLGLNTRMLKKVLIVCSSPRVPWTSSKPHVLRGLIPIALAGSKGYLQYPPAELKTSSIQIFAVKNKPFVG